VWSTLSTAIISIDSTTGKVKALYPGTFSVSYRLDEGDCTNTVYSDTYEVYSLPTFLVRPQSVCTGDQVELSDLVSGVEGLTVYYYKDSTGSALYNEAYLTVTESITIYIQAENSNHCRSIGRMPVKISVSDTIDLYVKDSVAICDGSEFNLALLVDSVKLGGTTLKNYLLSFYSITGDPVGPTVNPTSKTRYLLVAKVNGCTSTTQEVVVDVISSSQMQTVEPIILRDLCAGDSMRVEISTKGTITGWLWNAPVGYVHLTDSSAMGVTVRADSSYSGPFIITYRYEMGGCEGFMSSEEYGQFFVHPLPVLNVTPAEVCYGG
jgi:hypothetical protein